MPAGIKNIEDFLNKIVSLWSLILLGTWFNTGKR